MNIEGKYASEKENLNLIVKNATIMVSYKLSSHGLREFILTFNRAGKILSTF